MSNHGTRADFETEFDSLTPHQRQMIQNLEEAMDRDPWYDTAGFDPGESVFVGYHFTPNGQTVLPVFKTRRGDLLAVSSESRSSFMVSQEDVYRIS